MNKLIAFGEVLEDYVPEGDGFKKLVGGAPLNFLSMASQLGASSYMITGLSKDEGSQRVLEMMNREGVHTEFVKFDPTTSLCHTEVSVDRTTGEREFYFFKKNASFLSLNEDDIKEYWFVKGDVFHFGTVCLLGDSIYKAQMKACEIAQEKGCLISFDPNFRATLFKEEEQKKLVLDFISFADILKLSEDELKVMSDDGVDGLFRNYTNIKLIFLTKGSNGIDLCFRNEKIIHMDSIKPNKIVDTVGCGDCSFGAFISTFIINHLTENNNIDKLDESIYLSALKRAVTAGSLLCEQQGALPVPSKEIVLGE